MIGSSKENDDREDDDDEKMRTSPVIEVIDMDEKGGISKETQHRCRDEAACDVGSGLADKVDNHLQHCYYHNYHN